MSHPPQTHRTPEVIAAEIAAVDAFEGTKKDAFEALWKRWGHPNAVAKSFYYDKRPKAHKPARTRWCRDPAGGRAELLFTQDVRIVPLQDGGGRALQAGPPFPRLQERLLGGEAIEQPVAAGAAQICLAAASVRSARGMRRIPRPCRRVVPQPLAVYVAEHGRALGAAGPVATGAILAGRESAVTASQTVTASRIRNLQASGGIPKTTRRGGHLVIAWFTLGAAEQSPQI
jgi:hypothetical protein